MTTLSSEAPGETSTENEHDTSPARTLDLDDELLFPLSKAAVAQYWEDEDTPRELRIFYRQHEISFDDPAQWPFGETLIKHSRFRAGDAAGWVEGGWQQVAPLLQGLIEAGILHYADEEVALPLTLRHEEKQTLLDPARVDHGKTWDDAEEVIARISGEPLETGYVELVIPIFRVAHMYIDADNRQVGEANVFPPAMRLDRPTLWRTCTYSGTRYQADLPMNVTALRIMRTQWRQMMVIVRRVRDAYLARFPAARDAWTVGDIERMSVCVLALPTYMLMRVEGRVANGRLHPALSSAFRLTDGLRMLMHHMLFVPFGEPTRSSTTPMTGAEAHAYAERNYSFHTAQGVCAGPPAMVDDFLGVILDGKDPMGGWPDSLEPEVVEALDDLEAAMDYGLLGLQAFGSVFSLFPTSTAGHAELHEILLAWKGSDSPRLEALRDRSARIQETTADVGWLAQDSFRKSRLAAYNEMYQQCGFGLTGQYPEPSLYERYENPPPLPPATLAELERAFARHLHDLEGGEALFGQLAAWLGRYIAFVQEALRVSLDVQANINALLGRQPPSRPFQGRDLARYINMDKSVDSKNERREVPFLIDDIARYIGLTIDVTVDGVAIFEGARKAAPAQQQNSVAMAAE
ncbi:MAG: hypothetical protein JOZ90_12010 [Alphaproteobacteria bacterium]|nr:hypothetical protein [Alphaproteobacteria bacterium]MBV9371334.1 hypothetical protein [Alphaproteobacteria bacterium]MBV9901798.1 hypothetical protein [Alphaproteobacteria bacterium]